MEVTAFRQDGMLTIKPPIGRLDASVAQDFEESCARRAQGESRLAIDMSSIVFVDSAGLGALVSVLRSLGEGARLRLVGATRNVRTLLQLTRLDKVFELGEPPQASS